MKKIVALLLVLSVVLCAGCNQEEKSSKKSESAATQTDVQQTQQPEQTGDGLIVTGSAWKNDSIPEGAVLTKVG